MRNVLKLVLFFIAINSNWAASFYHEFTFPQDHGKHNEAALEWWDFFGHLVDNNNRIFGFSLNFMRIAVSPEQPPSLWRTEDIYISHFTITDDEAKQFYVQEKENRTSFNLAGANNQQLDVWNRYWRAFAGPQAIFLHAATKDATLDLQLTPIKPVMLLGENGFIESLNLFYYSFPSLQGIGTLRLGDHDYQITRSIAVMEHAFTLNKDNNIAWDKLIFQLNNGDTIFLYILGSNQNGFISPQSFCIINDASGKSILLGSADFQLTQLSSWYSEHSQINYPSGWTLTIPKARFNLKIQPVIKNQEIIALDNNYWEGQNLVTGEKDDKPIDGYAYVELSSQIARNHIL